MKNKIVITTFWALVVDFTVLMCLILIPSFMEHTNRYFFFTIGILFFVLGAVLLFVTIQQKVTGRLRRFLLLTGGSAVGAVIAAILHNVLYGVGIVIGDVFIISHIVEGLHILFFLISVPICPLAFLIGMIGSIVLLFKQ